jgi:hypothetical protein
MIRFVEVIEEKIVERGKVLRLGYARLRIGFTRHGKAPRLATADSGCIRCWFQGEPGVV